MTDDLVQLCRTASRRYEAIAWMLQHGNLDRAAIAWLRAQLLPLEERQEQLWDLCRRRGEVRT
jgi:hypothetical protein